MKMRLLLIDNYDSFTYNVYQYLRELGHDVYVFRNDKITLDDIREMSPDAIFLSPGPGTPADAGICIPVIKEFAGKISIFGICLGHQAIGEAFGAVVSHAKTLMHGKTSIIKPLKKGVMKEFDKEFVATRYHSLAIVKETLPDCLEITCESDDGEIMGVVHKVYNIEGVQFHPESVLTVEGKRILQCFLERTSKLIQTCSDNTKKIKQINLLKSNIRQFEQDTFMNIYQYTHKITISESVYQMFRRIAYSIGTDKVFLLESAYGPDIDCTKTIIGLFPSFEIKLDNKKLIVDSDCENIKSVLKKIIGKVYREDNGVFDIDNDRFSNVFNVISKSINQVNMHDLDIMINNGLVGYFGYEYLHYIENVPRKPKNVLNLPDVHLKYFQVLIEVEYNSKEVLIIENRIENREIEGLDEVISLIKNGKDKNSTDDFRLQETDQSTFENEKCEMVVKSNITKERFFDIVAKAKKYIYDGDIFQVQLGQRLTVEGTNIEALDLYDKLRKINPSPYMFFWDSKEYKLIGDSPELQLRIENGEVMIRPIAGTSKGKGHDEISRNNIIEKLKNDAKENAEHIMLVDLARNDIGIMAIPGTVAVTQLMSVEEFSHVFHLTSTVVGRLNKGLNSMEVFEATFPAGTLTGAPKVRAMEIISELESEIRGPYGGAFGFFDFNGNIVSSIIIRTVLKMGEKLYLQASAGIVADSIDENEWMETIYKMKATYTAIEELHTRRFEYAVAE
ncbi:hypothetical protein B9R14_01945 [Acetivibrio saccincola]|uniref:Uncharacterized protein n=2 Tax=Acetivibrio TaxID=35829 RepID=A0A2S8R795_9FIRM|nr:hypothetical protein B9R14_01945 [Acetivibrio saccincola]